MAKVQGERQAVPLEEVVLAQSFELEAILNVLERRGLVPMAEVGDQAAASTSTEGQVAAGIGARPGETAPANPTGPIMVTEALMMNPRAVAHVLRPLSEPLPLALQQRGQKVLETLEGLDGKDQLEVACRTVLAVLLATRPRFQGENELVFNDLCTAVLQWLQQEMKPLRFARPQGDRGEAGGASR